MASFFEELKRRKVYRVAVGYVIAAGGIIQLASAVFPAWELPNWTLRLVVVGLLLGFPIALLLAWAFDVTPQGIQTTAPVVSSTAGSRHRGRNVLLLVGLGMLISAVAGYFLLLPHAAATRMEKSIAVLPFENFSDRPDAAFFADGIQDDILTNLSKISDLKVISRTSVMAYRDQKTKNVRQIGKELGVSAVLEGSVRREGNRVRLNVQLINASDDHHIWAEDYDRELTDVFAIQTDLAQKIADELQAQLSPREKEQMMRPPTNNGEAYLAFVEAHNLQAALEEKPKLKQAVQLYQRAIELDPKFVQPVANLSILHSWLYHNFDPTDAERELARQYAEQALALAPDLPEAHLARGCFLYYGARDYDGALKEFAIAQQGLPNDSSVSLSIGAIQRRQGKWEESNASLEKAVGLNPKDTWPLQNLFFNYQMERDFKAAHRVIDRALAIAPHGFALWGLKAHLIYAERGDLSFAAKGLALLEAEMAKGAVKLSPDEQVGVGLAKATLLLVQAKYQEAVQTIDGLPLGKGSDRVGGLIEALRLKGQAQKKLGQTAAAEATLRQGQSYAEQELREAPNEARRHAQLAGILAELGQKETAIAEAKRATELLPISEDAFEGPKMVEALAAVYAVTGENAKAIECSIVSFVVPPMSPCRC